MAEEQSTMAQAQSTNGAGSNGSEELLLEVRNMKVYFPVTSGIVFQRQIGEVKAVDNVSFNIKRGETLGLVANPDVGRPPPAVESFS